MALINKDSFSDDNARIRANKGPLIRVEIAPGRFVKMYRADAEAAGHIAPTATKAAPPAENKMMPPVENKTVSAANTDAEMAEPDDLATIPGIGRASARALTARGITTFAQLRQATSLDFLSPAAQAAVVTWREAQDG